MINKTRFISLFCAILTVIALLCSCNAETEDSFQLTKNTNPNFQPEANAERIFSAQLKNGWSPWIYILLYDNARLEVYASNDGALTLDMCLAKAAEYLVFSEILKEDDYNKAQQLLTQLPELREEMDVNDAWIVTATYKGASYEYLLYPIRGELRNPEWSEFIHYLISVSVKDLDTVMELVPFTGGIKK